VGDLVFTAFSGSHQDAIKKGLAALDPNGVWEVPYLPIDPSDLGRSYESIIRVNSQSGKGGVSYLLERDYQLVLPRRLQIEFSRVVQAAADTTGKELTSRELWQLFEAEYLCDAGPMVYRSHQLTTSGDGADRERMTLQIQDHGAPLVLHGSGTGPIDAAVRALGLAIDVVGYDEHSCSTGSDAVAVAYVEVATSGGRSFFGVGRHSNIITASLLALISGVNRAFRAGALSWGRAVTTGT
jgi:2-isopropylmalate synthase